MQKCVRLHRVSASNAFRLGTAFSECLIIAVYLLAIHCAINIHLQLRYECHDQPLLLHALCCDNTSCIALFHGELILMLCGFR